MDHGSSGNWPMQVISRVADDLGVDETKQALEALLEQAVSMRAGRVKSAPRPTNELDDGPNIAVRRAAPVGVTKAA